MITFFDTGGNLLSKPKEKFPYSRSSPQSSQEPISPASPGKYYEICIKGQLSGIWNDWFDGLTIEDLDDDSMLISGFVADQSALMGIINKLVRLNLTLISINEIKEQKEKK